MENASKALIIAGAILLVIAIIAIAVGIVSKTRGTMDVAGGQIDSMAIEMHNKQFEIYEGTDKRYDEIKQLISDVAAYNNSLNNSSFEIAIIGQAYAPTVGNPNAIYSCCKRVKNYDNANTWAMEDFTKNCNLFTLDPNVRNKVWDVKFNYNSQGIIKEIVMTKEDKGF